MTDEFTVTSGDSRIVSLALHRFGEDENILFWSAGHQIFYRFINNRGVPLGKIHPVVQSTPADTNAKTVWPTNNDLDLNAISMQAVSVSSDTIALCVAAGRPELTDVLAIYLHPARGLSQVLHVARASGTGGDVSCQFHQQDLYIAWKQSDAHKNYVGLARIDQQRQIVNTSRISGDSPVLHSRRDALGDELLLVFRGRQGGKFALQAATVSSQLEVSGNHKLAPVKISHPEPVLYLAPEGVALAFRDNRDRDSKEEFYYSIVDQENRLLFAPRRISRADGPRGPRLAVSDDMVFSAQIRSYGKNYLVGFNRFGRRGTKMGGEFQVYADRCDFTLVEMVAHGNQVVLAYVEERDDSGRLLASSVGCQVEDAQ